MKLIDNHIQKLGDDLKDTISNNSKIYIADPNFNILKEELIKLEKSTNE